MLANEEQHHIIHSSLKQFDTYLNSVLIEPSLYSPSKVRSIITGFGSIFYVHLKNEMETITPEKLKAIFDAKDLAKLGDDTKNYVLSNSSKTTYLPWFITHHDLQTAPYWPPLPGPLFF